MKDQADRLRSLAEEALARIDRIAKDPGVVLRTTPKVLTVTSGKGGVGKTFIAVNLSVILARRGKKVLLFDADLGLANVNVQLGLVPSRDLGHFARGEASLEQVIFEGPSGVHVLSGGSGLSELYRAPTSVVAGALAELGRLGEKYDVVIIDTGAGLSTVVQRFLIGSSDLLLVTTSEPTALTDAYAVLKFIAEHSMATEVIVVANMCNEQEGARTHSALLTAARSFIKRPLAIKYGGSIPRDSAVRASILAQRAIVQMSPSSRVCRYLEQLAESLLKKPAGGTGNFVVGFVLDR